VLCDRENPSAEAIISMSKYGGNDLILALDKDGRTAFHVLCDQSNPSLKAMEALFECGDQDLLIMLILNSTMTG
jgi:hypothetical protein